MAQIVCSMAALSVAAVFRALLAVRCCRQRQLRERVTYMLWVMAKSVR